MIDYINGFVPPNAIFADIGAGMGKFTVLLARNVCTIFAVTEMNAIFDRENVDGLLRRDVVTKVYSERMESNG